MKLKNTIDPRLQFVLTMALTGTLGLGIRLIALPSSLTAFFRALYAVAAIVIFCLITRRKPDLQAIRRNVPLLVTGGIMMGLSWTFLFEAYKYTTMTVCTVCDNMAPIFMMIAAPVVLKEKMDIRKGICIFTAFLGVVLVSGILQEDTASSMVRGAVFALSAAVFYAGNVLVNKRLKDISSLDTVLIQLGITSVAAGFYTLFTVDLSAVRFDARSIIMTVVIGVVHTAIAYVSYYDAVSRLKAQTVAVITFTDPLVAVSLSVFVLREGMTLSIALGALLILGSVLVSELGHGPDNGNNAENAVN